MFFYNIFKNFANAINMKNKSIIDDEFKNEEIDPQGSYTGNPEDEEKPIQDADDL